MSILSSNQLLNIVQCVSVAGCSPVEGHHDGLPTPRWASTGLILVMNVGNWHSIKPLLKIDLDPPIRLRSLSCLIVRHCLLSVSCMGCSSIPLSLSSSPLPLRPMLISGDMDCLVGGSDVCCWAAL